MACGSVLAATDFMAQLDFSATPRFGGGELFPWVIYDYPLRQAIKDGIVKQPIRGEILDASMVESNDASPFVTVPILQQQ